MGVTGLWTVLQPCARPTRLETLNRHRLAIDASIWIYQFLKAVRDKEGNALRNSHVVGFFRRLCKLLYYGIKPVFVFDGGAPALKRQTILGRKKRREGRRDDAVRTAGKLLAIQMQRAGEEEEAKRKREIEVRGSALGKEQEEEIPDDSALVYVDEIGMSAQEREKTRKFTKKDAYHLPELRTNIENMGQPNDPRVMSVEELEEYARQFNSGEEINMYDFSKIDFDGDFFRSLPISDRYNILNAARLRSRLRMGYTKEQLEEMFPDRMEYSRFQIERVAQRNDLTQRLMNIAGMNGADAMLHGSGRIAGESSREYVLVKNDGVEGGWVLGVVSTDKEVGQRNKPIDIDELDRKAKEENMDEDDDEDEFEDVPVEGLNRLPKLRKKGPIDILQSKEAAAQRRKFYASRAQPGHSEHRGSSTAEEPDSMFVAEDGNSEALRNTDLFDDEEEDLNRAIAMSLGQQFDMSNETEGGDNEEFEDVPMPQWEQHAVEEPKPITSTNGRMVAHIVNNRANAAVPKRGIWDDDSSDDDTTLQATLAASRKRQNNSNGGPSRHRPAPVPSNLKNPFDGPLPFEKLDFKTSLFGKRTENLKTGAKDLEVEDPDESLEGGFEKNAVTQDAPKPLPPWLVGQGDIRNDVQAQQARDLEINTEDRERAREEERVFQKNYGIIEVESSDEDGSDVEVVEQPLKSQSKAAIDLTTEDTVDEVSTTDLLPNDLATAGALAENIRASPPEADIPQNRELKEPLKTKSTIDEGYGDSDEPIDWSESDQESARPATVDPKQSAGGLLHEITASKSPSLVFEDVPVGDISGVTPGISAGEPSALRAKSISPEFEDVNMPDATSDFPAVQTSSPRVSSLPVDDSFARIQAEVLDGIDSDDFSDPEDEELMVQLAAEAEEHAKFASTLNNKTPQENAAAYEAELKALRNQQKKDRRDADEVTHIMVQECQALLRFFGIPYITAPMEAEAQCAELLSLGLVDGIVTDDSDIFLFGGNRVYKNMFSKGVKDVECYLSTDIEKELTLSRQSLIQLAHLLGSDYTEGLPGVGPVTAVEILSEFPAENGLEEFKEWWDDVQLHSRPKEADLSSTFRKKFRRSQATKLFLPPAFPVSAVTEAYLKPEVDSTPEPFQWGVPDLDNIRSFLMSTIGWGPDRTDEVLVPVIKGINQREAEGTQSNITRYFGGGLGVGARNPIPVQPGGSSRMSKAVNKLKAKKKPLTGTFADEMKEYAEKEGVRERKEKAKERARTVERGGTVQPDEDEGDVVEEVIPKPKTQRKKKKKVVVEEEDDEDEDQEDESEVYIVTTKGKGRARPRKT